MIRLGKHVTQAGDQLLDVSMEKFYRALQNPNGEVASLQRRLQAVRAIDPAQYRRMKTALPYVVCADFFPKVRRKENFLRTERFILDLDHLSESDVKIDELRSRLKADPRIELLYTSPSGDGLKLFFKIDKPISDPVYYAAFYKAFALNFQAQYHLSQVLDSKTHDVSRCCFVSFDPDVYFKPDADPVSTEDILPKDSLFALDDLKKTIKEVENLPKKVASPETRNVQALPDEALRQIREKMGMKVRQPRPKDYVQPEELQDIVESMKKSLQAVGLILVESHPISYGRKCRIHSPDPKIWAEINVFTGKKGMSFVATTKTGSNKHLAKEIVGYLDSTINPLFQ